MPSNLGWHEELVFVSGFIEILLGVLLLLEKTRKLAAYGIILLLIAVFPANIQMAINWREDNHSMLWIAIARLPLQLVLIWWAWRISKIEKQELGQNNSH